MNHSFDIEHAQKYGVEAAIIINHFIFWIEKNKANGKHCHEGRTWTYNSTRAFALLFPYWSEQKIKRILLGLEEKGVLVTGNFNKSGIDRTKWYAFKNEQSFVRFRTTDCTDLNNALDGIEQAIPDINTDVKPVKKHNTPHPPDGVSLQTWEDFKSLRKAKRSLLTETALNGIRREAEKAGVSLQTALETCCERGWQGFKAEWYKKDQPQTYTPPSSLKPAQEDYEPYARRLREYGIID